MIPIESIYYPKNTNSCIREVIVMQIPQSNAHCLTNDYYLESGINNTWTKQGNSKNIERHDLQ